MSDTYDEYYDADVHDDSGEKIGGVGQVFLDEETGQPTWITVKTGLFGFKESFVPIEGITPVDGRLTVPYDKEFVKDAPRVDPDAALTEDDQDALLAYYAPQTQHVDAQISDDQISDDQTSDDRDRAQEGYFAAEDAADESRAAGTAAAAGAAGGLGVAGAVHDRESDDERDAAHDEDEVDQVGPSAADDHDDERLQASTNVDEPESYSFQTHFGEQASDDRVGDDEAVLDAVEADEQDDDSSTQDQQASLDQPVSQGSRDDHHQTDWVADNQPAGDQTSAHEEGDPVDHHHDHETGSATGFGRQWVGEGPANESNEFGLQWAEGGSERPSSFGEQWDGAAPAGNDSVGEEWAGHHAHQAEIDPATNQPAADEPAEQQAPQQRPDDNR